MRKFKLRIEPDPIPFANTKSTRAPLPYSIDRQDRRLFKRAWKKRTRGMTFVVLDKNKLRSFGCRKVTANGPLQKQLFLQPNRQRFAKTSKSLRRKTQIRLQQPIKFQQRFFVISDVIQ